MNETIITSQESLQEISFMKFEKIEVSECTDQDLMRVKCFACHEGVNENGTEFTRDVLKDSYKSFIDKPIIISADSRGMPTGHAYDRKTNKFIEKNRKYIGHIVDAYPCIVTDAGEIILPDENGKLQSDGEYRIICEFVVYKRYMSKVADIISLLQENEVLFFSMESVIDYFETPDKVKHCTKIHFTGLAIVKNPAFKHSFGLEVAEKEEMDLEYKEMYEEANARIETLIQEKTKIENDYETVVRERTTFEQENITLKDELAEAKKKIADTQSKVDELLPYKEKVEAAEKLKVGEERLEKLKKYGDVDKTAEELAELTKEEFADMVLEFAENYKPTVTDGYRGVPYNDSRTPDKKERLLDILQKL